MLACFDISASLKVKMVHQCWILGCPNISNQTEIKHVSYFHLPLYDIVEIFCKQIKNYLILFVQVVFNPGLRTGTGPKT